MIKSLLPLILATLLLSACQPSTTVPPAELGAEFELRPGRTVTVNGTGLTMEISAIFGDDRCPIGVECAATGPVRFSISVQDGSGAPDIFQMQTFTDNNGRAPAGPFEGITDRVEVGGYLIRVVAVLPHPQGFGGKVKAGDYRFTFVVTQK